MLHLVCIQHANRRVLIEQSSPCHAIDWKPWSRRASCRQTRLPQQRHARLSPSGRDRTCVFFVETCAQAREVLVVEKYSDAIAARAEHSNNRNHLRLPSNKQGFLQHHEETMSHKYTALVYFVSIYEMPRCKTQDGRHLSSTAFPFASMLSRYWHCQY
jgi:hypothetical protein